MRASLARGPDLGLEEGDGLLEARRVVQSLVAQLGGGLVELERRLLVGAERARVVEAQRLAAQRLALLAQRLDLDLEHAADQPGHAVAAGVAQHDARPRALELRADLEGA